MKFLLRNMATAIVALTLFNCSVEPIDNTFEQTDLRSTYTCNSGTCGARLRNNGTLSVDLAIYNHNNVLLFEQLEITPGTETNWQSFPIGQISYTVTTPATGLHKTVVIDMGECMVYDMEVAANDMLVTDQPTSGS